MKKFIRLGSLFFLVLGVTQPSALALTFRVTQITSEEAVFNEPSDTLTPTTLNYVLSFTVEPSGGGSSTQISTEDFFALAPDTVETPFPIQYKEVGDKLFAEDQEYLTAGTNGLSLSTGINKTTRQDPEAFFFPVVFLDPTAINDGTVDFFAADIANNQSPDLWELLDAGGNVVASLVTEGAVTNPSNPDWTRLGTQNLERFRNSDNQILNFDNRQLSGLAVELSDFVGLTALNASSVASMRITIADPNNTVDNRPRTDYAFISSNINSIAFENQVKSQEIPEPTSLLSLAVTLGLGLLSRKKDLT
ncbi:MAG: PEP-CTERM sorting domain-containing protein [Crocosphaera sp.]|nr:PEP-CTERM sorting domain-containing protein [Crocosphaera sp.]